MIKKRKDLFKRAGYSLVELMITVGIIGVLSGIVVPRYIGYREKSRRAEAFNTAPLLIKEAKLFYNKTDFAPCSIGQAATYTGACAVAGSREIAFPLRKIGPNDNVKLYYSYQVGPGDNTGGTTIDTYYPRTPDAVNNKLGLNWGTFSGGNNFNAWSPMPIIVRAAGRISSNVYPADGTALVDCLIFLSNGRIILQRDDVVGNTPGNANYIK